MSTLISDSNVLEKCPSKIVDMKESKELKNGLINALVHRQKLEMNRNETEDLHDDFFAEVKDINQTGADQPNHVALEDKVDSNLSKLNKRAKKKKYKPQLDSNENVNESKLEESNHGIITKSVKNTLILGELETYFNPENEGIELCPSGSKINSDMCDTISSDIQKLVIKDDSNNQSVYSERQEPCKNKIDFVAYESELQMPMIMKIIQKDLSEPYSVYTYRYFIHNWPKLCFLAMCDDKCVGAIVCKLDLHRKVVRRGYIAMLAVDQNYRKLRIGSTLVQMAIHEMTNGNADEVVLETEVTNKPALKLYEKLGFVRDKRLFRYYLNGVDALRLKLWLR